MDRGKKARPLKLRRREKENVASLFELKAKAKVNGELNRLELEAK